MLPLESKNGLSGDIPRLFREMRPFGFSATLLVVGEGGEGRGEWEVEQGLGRRRHNKKKIQMNVRPQHILPVITTDALWLHCK